MTNQRKHAELIKKWADGAEIESLHKERKQWVHTPNPQWYEDCAYRVKINQDQFDKLTNVSQEMADSLADCIHTLLSSCGFGDAHFIIEKANKALEKAKTIGLVAQSISKTFNQ